MFKTRKTGILLAIFVLLAIVLVACQPEEVEVTTVVEVEVPVEIVVTATAEPVAEVEYKDSTPDTYVEMTFGDIDTMDPSLNYDTASANLLWNVMEGLITFDHKDGTSYIPALATEVPSLENGGISEDGLTYTWHIREGVTFHEGGDLTAADVAYSIQRGLLQSDPNGPQWLLIEPFLGSGRWDITEPIAEGEYAGDPEGLIANASAEELVTICEEIKERVVDNGDGTVTFNLAIPWGPFLATMAGGLGNYIMDMEWAVEQGAWDGDCATWQNWYAPGSENSELTAVVNGTGPYKLDHWTPGEEFTMVANENYWRTEPMWEGGPSGVAAIETIIVRIVNEWGTRFAALQAGDAENVSVPTANRPQVDAFVGEHCDWVTDECVPDEANPEGPIRKYSDLPGVSRSNVFMTWDISEDSTYIGSGELDGNGIPPDFFSDVDVRKAMHYCFDYDTFIAEAQLGEGVRNNGPIIRDMLGYNEDGPYYQFDLEKCEEHLATAWGGVLPETGFRFSAAFNTGNTTRQTASEILQANLRSINPNYQVDIVGLPWPTFLRSFRSAQIPVLTSGWIEDIHDPHNWAQPFTIGTYGGRQNLPDDIIAKYTELVNAGVLASDPAEREQIYFELQQAFYDDAISIPLSQQTGVRYEQRWVQDWFNRVGSFGRYFYAYSLDG
jgi:peptide/nickel transport system substrate-binding protein